MSFDMKKFLVILSFFSLINVCKAESYFGAGGGGGFSGNHDFYFRGSKVSLNFGSDHTYYSLGYNFLNSHLIFDFGPKIVLDKRGDSLIPVAGFAVDIKNKNLCHIPIIGLGFGIVVPNTPEAMLIPKITNIGAEFGISIKLKY